MDKITFGLLGSGWRADFYRRVAEALPERFHLSAVWTHSPGRTAELQAAWNVPVFDSLEAFLAHGGFRFAVVCLNRAAAPEYTARLAERDIPVLAETPPAADLHGLRALWERLGAQTARVQVAEQYAFQPMHAARLALARSGRLGNISHVQVSAAHDYHGVSLMRGLLGAGFGPAAVRGVKLTAPLAIGPGRSGPPAGEGTAESEQTLAVFDFGGKTGVYDFAKEQYFSWIRNSRTLIRGERGEIVNQEASWLEHYDSPVYAELRRVDAGHGGNLEGLFLKGILCGSEWLYRNPFAPTRLTEDEIAVAESLVRMDEFVRGGPPVYTLAEACQDQYLALAMHEAVLKGTEIVTEPQVWAPTGN